MYSSLKSALLDLEKNKMLVRIKAEIDPDLEMAEVHRRVFDAGGPALWFENVKGSPFSAASNIYSTPERMQFLFRKTLERVKRVVELKLDPTAFFKKPGRYLGTPFTALTALPMRSRFGVPVAYAETTIDKLPQIKSWPMDGGAFVTMPQVFTEDPDMPSLMHSNLGMYRIQLSGNDYVQNEEIGLHYQLHRGIGVHHTKYNALDKPFPCSIFVGGPPAHAFSAIMPLPEGMSELTFAGMLAGRRFRYARREGYFLSSDADFVITGEILKNVKKREGPFGDHIGYYSLEHDFPVMRVHKVWHRKDAVWHFSVVGRPPQEDSSFGWLIHELVKDLAPQEFPGLHEIHAVDVAGVHPLLLAIGSERYMPFRERKPEEILTTASRILGTGQTSLAKYLIIAAHGDAPRLDTHDMPHFFQHVLERIDWTRDLHFHTRTTIDTLDYSGSGWNEGSKVVIACCGDKKRALAKEIPTDLNFPEGFGKVQMAMPGVLVIQAPKFENHSKEAERIDLLSNYLKNISNKNNAHGEWPLVVLVDDGAFTALNTSNFLWVTFTRSNPSHDIYGVDSFTEFKHWGCRGALIIDARIKPHHAPELVVDKKTKERVDKLFMEVKELREL